MRTEHDLRAALRVLERETPHTAKVLSRVAERTGVRTPARGPRPGRRVLAGLAAAATVVAIAVAAGLLATPHRGQGAPPSASIVPRYYMALVPFKEQGPGVDTGSYAVVKDRITGRTLATVQPPKPYEFEGVSGAADDRTFVLTAQGNPSQPPEFIYARFDPANDTVTDTLLALPGLPILDDFDTAALSPDGTKLAVASVNYRFTAAQIKVYSLPSGAAKTWSVKVNTSMVWADAGPDELSWSSTGTLAFGWIGSIPGNTLGVYLLNTNGAGGGLLADSQEAFCPVAVKQGRTISINSDVGSDTAFLTPDGSTFISSVPQPIPVGQRPPSCTSRGLAPAMPELEEFSVSTGQATSVLYASHAHDAVGAVYWSNPSGSVLVVFAQTRPGLVSQGDFGILAGNTFTRIPGSSIPPLVDIAF
jgi:hypothetical protein